MLGSEESELESEISSIIDRVFKSHIHYIKNLVLLTVPAVREKSQLVLSGDTGIGHLAAAVGANSIIFAGATNVWRTFPYREDTKIIFKNQIFQTTCDQISTDLNQGETSFTMQMFNVVN